MAYRNKTFVSFASEDLHYYRLMCAWRKNKNIDFDFLDAHDINTARDTSSSETINRRLGERLSSTKQVVMLIGDETRTKAAKQTSFLHHEVQTILSLDIPVVFAHLNKSRASQSHRVPAALTERYSIAVGFGPIIVKHALDDFPPDYHANLRSTGSSRKSGVWHYKDHVYKRLGL